MENIILNSLSAAAGGILFAVTFILCALLVLAIRTIDVKTSSKVNKSNTPPPENEDGEKVYYVVKSKKNAK